MRFSHYFDSNLKIQNSINKIGPAFSNMGANKKFIMETPVHNGNLYLTYKFQHKIFLSHLILEIHAINVHQNSPLKYTVTQKTAFPVLQLGLQ